MSFDASGQVPSGDCAALWNGPPVLAGSRLSTGKVCSEGTWQGHAGPRWPSAPCRTAAVLGHSTIPCNNSHIQPPESTVLACNLPAPSLHCPAELFLQLQQILWKAGAGKAFWTREQGIRRVLFSQCLNMVRGIFPVHMAPSLSTEYLTLLRPQALPAGQASRWAPSGTGGVLSSLGSMALQGAGGWHPWGRATRWPRKRVAGVSPAWPLPKGSGQSKGLLPAPSCGESQLSCHCQDPQWLSCCDADIPSQNRHIKPGQPPRQGCGEEQTCTREQASHTRCLQKVRGHKPLRRQRALLWPGGTPCPGYH